jgi:pimeloyl-ACP methyl ester carboxylesterase
LVIAGRYDFICGVRWAKELNSLVPRAQLVILEKSGHLGQLEEPEAFAQAVIGFVDSTWSP